MWKSLILTINITSCILIFGCNRNNIDISHIYDKLAYHYEYEDPNIQKIESAKFLCENLRYHYPSMDKVINQISYDFLVEHIDYTYELWHISPYAKELNFEEFKEYLLPFFACPGIEPHITAKHRANWLRQHNIKICDGDLPQTILRYNSAIDSLRHLHLTPSEIQRQGLSDLTDTIYIDCADKANHCIQNLRALGIPCIAERNMCYRKLLSHHVHCAIYIPNTGRFMRFNAEDTTSIPDSCGWNFIEMQNIYRLTFSRQHNSPFFLRKLNEGLLPPFDTPCITDVTRCGRKIILPFHTDDNNNIVYLATFNNSPSGFMPVTWGLTNKTHEKVIFNTVLPGTLYFPIISNHGKFKTIGAPFYLTEDNDTLTYHLILSDNLIRQSNSQLITRKYPIKEKTRKIISELVGSSIEASNQPDFSDYATVKTLSDTLLPQIQTVKLYNTKPYRYYRFRSPSHYPSANISVLKWIDNNGTYLTENSNNPAYDNNMTTAPSKEREICLTLDNPTCVTSIEIAPLNANNGINPNHKYRLKVFNNTSGIWETLYECTAKKDFIQFDNIPSGTLLWLSDLTDGREEMPFIFQNGQQKFIYHDIIPYIP